MATGSAIHRWRTRFALSWPAESTATARARLANGDGEREPACGRRVGLPRKAIVEDQHLLPRVRRRESPDLDDSLDRAAGITLDGRQPLELQHRGRRGGERPPIRRGRIVR